MTRFHRVVAAVSLALLLTGCELPSISWLRTRSAPVTEAPAPAPTPPPPPAVTMERLFPPADWHATYAIQDQGKTEVKVEEDWLRDGQRMIATQGGVPYVTWLLQDEGLWRLDPKGGGVFLRYLPAKLQDGVAWKQQSAGKDVWFALTDAASACGPWQSALNVDQCWQLQVINRGELTTFLLGGGVGILKADAVNYTRPADSFVKTLKVQKTGTPLMPTDRKSVLDKTGAVSAEAAAVIPSTMADFQKALQTLTAP